LFTDVRGSTTLAEQMTPSEFRSLLDRFFKAAFLAVDAYHGVVDHIVGDGVMAMWTQGFGGPDHAEQTVGAGRKLVADMASDPILSKTLPAGIGVHTGLAWVGVVGETGAHDFTVLGDVPNTVARLGSSVAGGELAMSDEIVKASGVNVEGHERRLLDLKGKAEPFPVWIETAPLEAL
jgi:adenylate cyclase